MLWFHVWIVALCLFSVSPGPLGYYAAVEALLSVPCAVPVLIPGVPALSQCRWTFICHSFVVSNFEGVG